MKWFTNTQLLQYFVCAEALVAFFMPIDIHLDTYCIFALACFWVFTKGWEKLIYNPVKLKWVLLFSSLFILYLLRTFFFPGMQNAQPEIIKKVPLLIFPLLLFGGNDIKSKMVLYALPAGCLLASMLCLGNAATQYKTLGYNALFYVNLSSLMHPGYFAMYINFSIFILLDQLFIQLKPPSAIIKWISILLILFFTVMIIFLSSKAGIIGFYIVIVFCALVFYIKKRKFVYTLVFALASIVLFNLFSAIILKGQQDRLTQSGRALITATTYSADTTETAEMRVLIWQVSIQVIKNNFWTGVGTNAEAGALRKIYSSRNMVHELHTNLNAHNQFLQTFIALGIVGFFMLLITLVVPVLYSYKFGNYLFILFILLIVSNFLIESILQTQAGVVFYAFFNSYLFQDKITGTQLKAST